MKYILLPVVSLILLLLSVASFVGLIYITPLGFGTKKIQDYSTSIRKYIKIFLILTWIGIILNILYIIYNIYSILE